MTQGRQTAVLVRMAHEPKAGKWTGRTRAKRQLHTSFVIRGGYGMPWFVLRLPSPSRAGPSSLSLITPGDGREAFCNSLRLTQPGPGFFSFFFSFFPLLVDYYPSNPAVLLPLPSYVVQGMDARYCTLLAHVS
jgi:hypothetical protein